MSRKIVSLSNLNRMRKIFKSNISMQRKFKVCFELDFEDTEEIIDEIIKSKNLYELLVFHDQGINVLEELEITMTEISEVDRELIDKIQSSGRAYRGNERIL